MEALSRSDPESASVATINTAPLASFPDEMVEKIISYAAIIPGELDVVHPADGNDPFFQAFASINDDYMAQWEDTLITRAALALVSRQFWRLATPFLYSSFSIDNTGTSSTRPGKFMSTIEEKPHLANLVIRLNFRESTYPITCPAKGAHRLFSRCHNISILHSSDILDFETLPTRLRVLVLWYPCAYSYSTLKYLLRLQRLEVLALNAADFRNMNTPGQNDSTITPFTHSPSLRTVLLEGQITMEGLKAILHPESPITALELTTDDSSVTLSTAYPLMANITHLTGYELDFYDAASFGRGQLLLPKLEHLMLSGRAIASAPDLETKLGFDSIHSLSTYFPVGMWVDPDGLIRWINHLERRVSHKGQDGQGSLPLKFWYTNGTWTSRHVSHDYLSRLRAGVEALACVGVTWIVQTESELIPMKDMLAKLTAQDQESINSHQSATSGP